ncbi:MAG TPA: hypothetical protein VJV75_08900 [Candidatus Polarisedimenticolia bacterium]|nr:hypothetical protein [Candidatus Polarisedimenticolia bacterium]
MPAQNPAQKPQMPAPGAAGRMIVARFVDGRTLKGTTHDFLPNRPTFHIYVDGNERSKAETVSVADLKAVFFVKDYAGSKDRTDVPGFDGAQGFGRNAQVTFADGETISGRTTGYNPTALGFFLLPADAGGNNTRIYVVNKAVRKFEWK